MQIFCHKQSLTFVHRAWYDPATGLNHGGENSHTIAVYPKNVPQEVPDWVIHDQFTWPLAVKTGLVVVIGAAEEAAEEAEAAREEAAGEGSE